MLSDQVRGRCKRFVTALMVMGTWVVGAWGFAHIVSSHGSGEEPFWWLFAVGATAGPLVALMFLAVWYFLVRFFTWIWYGV